jgi:hypothetical protein
VSALCKGTQRSTDTKEMLCKYKWVFFMPYYCVPVHIEQMIHTLFLFDWLLYNSADHLYSC